jgi:hypothetical protein
MLKRAEPLRREAERRLNEIERTQIRHLRFVDNLALNRRKTGFPFGRLRLRMGVYFVAREK